MNCTRCGRPLDPGAAFCGNCGQPAVTAVAAPAQQVPAQPQQAQQIQPVQPGTQPAEMLATQAAPQPVTPAIAPGIAQPQPGVPVPPSPGMPQSAVPPAPSIFPGQPGQIPQVPVVNGAPIPPMPGPAPLPLYAIQAAPTQPGGKRSVVGLILAVLSLPGMFIPIIGIGFGIAGIVMGSLSLRFHKTLGVLAILFGSLGTVLSIVVFVLAAQQLTSGAKLSSQTQNIDTSCFSFTLSKSLHVTNDASNCGVTAFDQTTADKSHIGYFVKGFTEPNIDPSSFADDADQTAKQVIKNSGETGETYHIVSQASDTFAGKTAYKTDAESNQGRKLEIEYVLDDAPTGQNLFMFMEVHLRGDVDLSPIANGIKWK